MEFQEDSPATEPETLLPGAKRPRVDSPTSPNLLQQEQLLLLRESRQLVAEQRELTALQKQKEQLEIQKLQLELQILKQSSVSVEQAQDVMFEAL